MNRKRRNRKPQATPNSESESSSKDSEVQNSIDHARARRFKVFIVALSVILFLALDLVCGIFVVGDQQRSFRQPHPFYHHGLRGNQQRRTHWGGHRYNMVTNSLGFRDREMREVPLESDRLRVLLIGDSMMEGLGVEYDETVAGQLQQRWAPEGIDVLNAGVVSYSPHLYYLRVRHLIEEVGLRLNQLIVFIDISDIQDETFYENFQPSDEPVRQPGWWRRHSLMFRVAEQFGSGQRRTNNQFRTDAEVNVWMGSHRGLRCGNRSRNRPLGMDD